MDTFQIRWPGAYCECVGPKKSKLMMTPDVDIKDNCCDETTQRFCEQMDYECEQSIE